MDRETLKSELIRDEGLELKLYRCTAGKLSIGVGRNLEDKGISKAAAMFLLNEDIDETIANADRLFPWWRTMSENRQRAFLNFLFNVGPGTALTFKKTMLALKEQRWEDAAKEFENSLWYRQVGNRAKRIVEMIRNG